MPVTSFANTDETQVPNLTTLVSSLMNWAPPLRTYWKVVRMMKRIQMVHAQSSLAIFTVKHP